MVGRGRVVCGRTWSCGVVGRGRVVCGRTWTCGVW